MSHPGSGPDPHAIGLAYPEFGPGSSGFAQSMQAGPRPRNHHRCFRSGSQLLIRQGCLHTWAMTSPAAKLHKSLWRTARGERCELQVCGGACCVNGIWVDLGHVQRILDAADQVRPFMAPEYAGDEDRWFGDETLETIDFPSGLGLPTAVAPRADASGRQGCVFVRADHKCALQMASVAMNLASPGLKPLDCATYPILRSDGVIQVDDESARHHPGADCQQGGPTQRQMREVFAEEVALCLPSGAELPNEPPQL